MASDMNIVQKSGAWFSMDGERIGQGRDNARNYLEQHPELLEKLEKKILAQAGINRGGAPAAAAPTPGEGAKSGKGEAAADSKAAVPNGAQKPKPQSPVRPS
jgi:recombination protein RecA